MQSFESSIYRKYHYEIEWEINGQIGIAKFNREVVSEFDAVTYAIDWMQTNKINSSNLMYCRVEEVFFDSEMRTNVLLWIGE